MPRSKDKTARKNLMRRVRRQRLKYITILPSLVTILNGICGFTAIVFASKGETPGPGGFSYFSLSGYMVVLAMIADMLDGRLARMNQSTSSFGGQLDSLCDIISFGVAPAFLMLKVLVHKLSGFAGYNPTIETFIERFIWVAAAGYISCSAIRLARFNVENEEDESAHMSFIGLPTPAAAGVLVSLVILHQDTFQTIPKIDVIIYALPFSALGTAALMVSRLRYPHILNQYLRGKKPFAYLIRTLLLLAFISWTSIQAALALIFCSFAASSFVKWFYYKVIRNKHNIVSAAQSALISANKDQIANEENIGYKAEE